MRLPSGALLPCSLGLGPSALAGMQDCDWVPTGGTGQQIERKLREELACRLKQFDG